jgi:hypothetical protein
MGLPEPPSPRTGSMPSTAPYELEACVEEISSRTRRAVCEVANRISAVEGHLAEHFIEWQKCQSHVPWWKRLFGRFHL